MGFQLPHGSEYYISLQRTQYQLQLMRKVERFLPGSMVHGTILRWIESFRRKKISSLYYRDMKNEFNSLEPFLKSESLRILDIGCGIGGVDVLISQKCEGRADFYLVDKTRRDEIYYGLKPKAAFYNDFRLTESFLIENGVPVDRIHFVEAGEGRIASLEQSFDLIFSLISWGFHYPLSTYLEEVLSALAPNGALVLDLRRGSGDMDALRARIDVDVEIVNAYEKYDRIVIRHRVEAVRTV